MALGILMAAGMEPTKAIAKVQSLRSFIIPNRLMISILDEILDQQGELMRVVLKHYALLPADASLPDRGGGTRELILHKRYLRTLEGWG